MKAQMTGGTDCILSDTLFCLLVCRSNRKSFHLKEDIRVEVGDGDF